MTWQIDNAHTHIGFSVKHMMVSTVRGNFGSYRGKLELDPTDFTKSKLEGEIDVESINTGNEQRDAHLRTNDFFDAKNHPKINFKSTRIEKKDDNEYVVHGELTIRGVTKEVAVDVEWSGTNKNPWGKVVTGLSAKTTINRKDFGVNFNAALETGGVLISEKVKIEVEVEAVADALAA
jgi:polyisoprenoid-binding protein YceI